ncbi:hypothetical protein, partial [Levilactobacillus namurensis]|uniref:hypothetical protein n=1 Tax=Levilactobacillus namurensis TaxID=380393 RepID=UPI002230DC34
MRHTEYGYVSPIEDYCYRDLERWLADKKKRERRADKHGAFNLESKGKHIKPEAGSSDGMIVNKDYIFTENYSDE